MRDEFSFTALVAQFADKFDLAYDGPPRQLDEDLFAFRRRFLLEELDEYLTAHLTGNMEGMLDGLVDLIYVAVGTALLHGFDLDEAFRRVHAANMRKARAESVNQSSRGHRLDVVKPPGWTPPWLKDLVMIELCESTGCTHGRRGPNTHACIRINCPARARR